MRPPVSVALTCLPLPPFPESEVVTDAENLRYIAGLIEAYEDCAAKLAGVKEAVQP